MVLWPALAVGGCQSAPHAAPSARFDTLPNGTVVVRNEGNATPIASGWSVHSELRLGSVDGGDDEFGAVFDILPERSGRFYVLMPTRAELRLFDNTGHHVRTIGRRGQGPGEFLFPTSAALDGRDHLWVADPRNLRYAEFDTAGNLTAIHRRAERLAPIPATSFLGRDAEGTMYDGDERWFDPTEPTTRRFRLDAQLMPVDSVVVPVRIEGYELPFGPYAPRRLVRFDGRGYVWIARNDEYRLIQLSFGGDTLRIVERAVRPNRIGSREHANLLARYQLFRRSIGAREGDETFTIPSVRPPLADFAIDEAGYLWVARATERDCVTRSFEIFDPEGQFLGAASVDFDLAVECAGTATFAPRRSPIRIVGDVLYAVTFDEWDVPYVVVGQVHRRGRF